MQQRQRRQGAQAAMEASGKESAEPPPPQAEAVPLPRQLFRDEARARIDAALDAEIGFVERLVWFWSNHFCVNADKTVMAGGYEREAIRPHVLGRFSDMLLAVEEHPAMLIYLDNAQSIGPNSVAGINRDKGLNENLAREILELHTLGVRSVYTQDDVTSFAKALTGWTILPTATNPDHGGEFVYLKRAHEPGPQIVLGKSTPIPGRSKGRAVLADLARHPATARHVATKLARHFIADDPPPALVDRLTRRFLDTDGDLKEVALALGHVAGILVPRAGQDQAAGRVDRRRPARDRAAWRHRAASSAGRSLLGEPLWRPPAPKGFSDDNAAWLDGLAQRLDIANIFAQRVGERPRPPGGGRDRARPARFGGDPPRHRRAPKASRRR